MAGNTTSVANFDFWSNADIWGNAMYSVQNNSLRKNIFFFCEKNSKIKMIANLGGRPRAAFTECATFLSNCQISGTEEQ